MLKSPLACYTDEQYSSFPFEDRVLIWMASQVGVIEDPVGSNLGKDVERYAAAVHGPKGAPWCAEFLGAGCIYAGCPEKLLPDNMASTHSWKGWAANLGRLHQDGAIRGDAFYIEHSATTGHVGGVTEVHGDEFLTIEGNTNSDGGREGYAVLRRDRNDNPKTWFIRLKGLCE